ncbi:MAG: tetratricopeptide repeat protein [Terracidiphilus sp.]
MGNLRRNWNLPGCAMLMAVLVPALAQSAPDQAVNRAMQEGTAQMKAGNFAQAADAYGNVTRLQPGFAEGYFNLGLAEQQAGRLDEARVALEKAVRLKPALRGAHLFLGILAYRQNRFEDAKASLLKETQLDPSNAKAFMWLGVCLLAQDNPQAAIAPLDKAFALDGSDVDILYHRGRAYLLVANASYDAMFKLDHDSLRVHQVLGEAYAQGYRNDNAISEFELAVKLAPRQPGLHEELADQYWIVGNVDKAAEAYREELRIDPNAVSSMYKLGGLLAKGPSPADGIPLLRSALRIDPGLNDAHYYLGEGLVSAGKDAEAIQEFEAAIAADPANDRAMTSYYRLALIYRKLHKPQDAQAALANYQRMRADVKARQDSKTAELVRRRTELPVNDDGVAATASANE